MTTHNSAFSYASKAERSTSHIFYKSFLKKMEVSLIKYFGESEAIRCMKILSRRTVNIVNPETFFFNSGDMGDTSLQTYNNSTSLEEFIHGSTLKFLQRAELGDTEIEVREFFFVLADMLSNEVQDIDKNYLRIYLKEFLLSLSKTIRESPFKLILTLPTEAARIGDIIGLDTSRYKFLFNMLISCIKEIKSENFPTNLHMPSVEVHVPIYKDTKYSQMKYLSIMLHAELSHVQKLTREIQDLSQDTSATRVIIERLAAEKDTPYDMSVILTELERLSKDTPFRTYSVKKDLSEPLRIRNSDISRKDMFSYGITYKFVERDSFEFSFTPYLMHMRVICSNKSFNLKTLESYLSCCKTLGLLKYYHLKDQKIVKLNTEPVFKISLCSVKKMSQEFLDRVNEKISNINSITNKKFIAEIFYTEEIAQRRSVTEEKPRYFRIISDIHEDYNKSHNYTFNFANDFVLNCGDTSSNAVGCARWHETYVKQGVFVVGNHFGYTSAYPELDGIQNMETYGSTTNVKNTKNIQIEELTRLLGAGYHARILSNSMLEYEGIIILGSTLYTDFALYGKDHIEECMQYAKKRMNDFRYPTVIGHREYTLDAEGNWKIKMLKRSESKVRPFTPSDHAYFFHYSINYLKEKVLEYKNKPIIIVTHHAPSPYSISKEYAGDLLNAAFVSNLNQFILDNPQIRIWAHGHCVDDNTEVLTVNGWKHFNQIKETDKVLNLNPTNHKIEEDQINAVISKLYTGNVYYFHSKGSDIRVTEDHDMLTIYRRTKKLTKIKAKDLYNKKQKFIIRAGIQDKKGINLSDNLLRLLVWISADGNRPDKNSNLVRFRLFKERKIKKLQDLLNNLNIQYRTYYYSSTKGGGCSINFDLPSELKNFSFKPIDPIISQCNQHQCSVILEEYANTDGVHNGNTIIIYTSKKEEANTIQLMCITNGYGCSISERINHGFKLQSGKRKISYELNIVSNPYRCIDNPHRTTTVEHVTNEHFWCLNTNNGTLIIRRNGKVNITGNCHTPFDYILGQTRIICCPFGYNNENKYELPNDYGTRVFIEDVKSKKPWTDICAKDIELGLIKYYPC